MKPENDIEEEKREKCNKLGAQGRDFICKLPRYLRSTSGAR